MTRTTYPSRGSARTGLRKPPVRSGSLNGFCGIPGRFGVEKLIRVPKPKEATLWGFRCHQWLEPGGDTSVKCPHVLVLQTLPFAPTLSFDETVITWGQTFATRTRRCGAAPALAAVPPHSAGNSYSGAFCVISALSGQR